MNEKLTLRESIVCRLLLLIARILAKSDEGIKRELEYLDARIGLAS